MCRFSIALRVALCRFFAIVAYDKTPIVCTNLINKKKFYQHLIDFDCAKKHSLHKQLRTPHRKGDAPNYTGQHQLAIDSWRREVSDKDKFLLAHEREQNEPYLARIYELSLIEDIDYKLHPNMCQMPEYQHLMLVDPRP